jgi:hypothetical protein
MGTFLVTLEISLMSISATRWFHHFEIGGVEVFEI